MKLDRKKWLVLVHTICANRREAQAALSKLFERADLFFPDRKRSIPHGWGVQRLRDGRWGVAMRADKALTGERGTFRYVTPDGRPW